MRVAEGTGIVKSGEKKAQKRPYGSLKQLRSSPLISKTAIKDSVHCN